MELFNLKGNVISSGNQYYFVFFKNKHIFEKTSTIAFFEIFFSRNLCHIETIQMTGLNIIQYFTRVSEQTLVTATAISCKIALILYDLNSTNQGY